MVEILVHILPKMLAAFTLMILYIHLSGKGALAPISAIDQVGNVALGTIIGGTLFDPGAGLPEICAIIVLWAGLLLALRFLANRHMRIKDAVDGEAIRLMRDGEVLSENFDRAGLAIRDFNMLLHQRGFKNLDEIKDVWFEYDGRLSVIRKGDEGAGVVVVENGEINRSGLQRLNRSEAWLNDELARRHTRREEVFCAEWHDGKLWLYPIHRGPAVPEPPENPGRDKSAKR